MSPATRIRRLEKQLARTTAENERMAEQLAVKAPLWPGDTPSICAARLKAAGDESAGWARRRAA